MPRNDGSPTLKEQEKLEKQEEEGREYAKALKNWAKQEEEQREYERIQAKYGWYKDPIYGGWKKDPKRG